MKRYDKSQRCVSESKEKLSKSIDIWGTIFRILLASLSAYIAPTMALWSSHCEYQSSSTTLLYKTELNQIAFSGFMPLQF